MKGVTVKLYFCNTIGDGSIDDPFRPAISQYTDDYRAVDAREDPTIPGLLMVECPTISDEHHDLAIINPDITYFDTEGLLLDDVISKIPDRAALIFLTLIIFFWSCATVPRLPILIPVYITSKFTDKTRILGVDVYWAGWARNMFLSDDQSANTTLGGSMDNTCSSRIGNNAQRGNRIALKMAILVDLYFLITKGQKNHCRASIENNHHHKNWGG